MLALSARSCASSHFIAHHHVLLRIFTFHRASSRSRASSGLIMHLRILVHLWVLSCIFVFHRASPHFIAHPRVSSCIVAFHRNLVRIIAGASIHCPASSLVHRIPFITISDYVWHRTIIISLWTLTLPHLHT
jgi:hypothetical protein